jgi:hypothetical protein
MLYKLLGNWALDTCGWTPCASYKVPTRKRKKIGNASLRRWNPFIETHISQSPPRLPDVAKKASCIRNSVFFHVHQQLSHVVHGFGWSRSRSSFVTEEMSLSTHEHGRSRSDFFRRGCFLSDYRSYHLRMIAKCLLIAVLESAFLVTGIQMILEFSDGNWSSRITVPEI